MATAQPAAPLGAPDLPANLRRFMRQLRKEDRSTQQAGRRLIEPLRFEVHDGGRKLRLPKDYKYSFQLHKL